MDARPSQNQNAERFPLVSIVIPVYRGHPFLAKAIDSALAQTWPEIEVIVVDDGSDDDGVTRSIIQRYGDRLRHIEQENGGVAAALNTGIAAMKGEYFTWLSHDDLYHPLKVDTQMRAMLKLGEPAILFGDYDVITPNGTHDHRVEFEADHDPDQPIWDVFEGRLNGCTLLIPKECFERCGTFSRGLPTTQDYELWFNLARTYRFAHVPGALVRHRSHPAQGSKTDRHLEEASLLWISMLERLTVAEMQAIAGSELKFLVRAMRFLRKTGFIGARLYLDKRLRTMLRQRPVTLIWGSSDQAYGASLAEAVMRIEQADLWVDAVAIIESQRCSPPLGSTTGLREGLSCSIYRIASSDATEAVLDIARKAGGREVIVADARSPLDTTQLRSQMEQVIMEETDVALLARLNPPPQTTPVSFCLPTALSGALISGRVAQLDRAKLPSGGTPLSGLKLDLPPPIYEQPVPSVATGLTRGSSDLPGQLSRAPDPARPTLLVVSRGLGGGAARYAALLGQIAARRCNVLYASGCNEKSLHLSASSPDHPEQRFDLPEQRDACLALLRAWKVNRVDVVHTDGLREHLPGLLKELGVPYDLTMVDYHMVAGSPHLSEATEITDNPPLPKDFLTKAARRIAISQHTAMTCAEYAPDLDFIAARPAEPHDPRGFELRPAPVKKGEAMRVLLLSPLVPHKGSEIVAEVAARLRRSGLPIEFHAISWPGNPMPDLEAQQNLRLHDLRDPSLLNRFVCLYRPHLAWLPLIAPETHSFVASDAMLQGLPILASAVGALPERLLGRDSTWLVDPAEDVDAHATWLRRLLEEGLASAPNQVDTDHLPALKKGFYPDIYLRPLFD